MIWKEAGDTADRDGPGESSLPPVTLASKVALALLRAGWHLAGRLGRLGRLADDREFQSFVHRSERTSFPGHASRMHPGPIFPRQLAEAHPLSWLLVGTLDTPYIWSNGRLRKSAVPVSIYYRAQHTVAQKRSAEQQRGRLRGGPANAFCCCPGCPNAVHCCYALHCSSCLFLTLCHSFSSFHFGPWQQCRSAGLEPQWAMGNRIGVTHAGRRGHFFFV